MTILGRLGRLNTPVAAPRFLCYTEGKNLKGEQNGWQSKNCKQEGKGFCF